MGEERTGEERQIQVKVFRAVIQREVKQDRGVNHSSIKPSHRAEPVFPQSWNSRLRVSSLRPHGTAPEPEGRATSLRLPAVEVPRWMKPRQSWGPRAG